MNSEAAEILASALEQDASNHEGGNYSSIGSKWDDVYAELLPIEDDINNPIYGLAFRFWDDWCDSSNHDWQYHEPMTRDMWPGFAREIASALREGRLPEKETIINEFFPRPKVSWVTRIKSWFSKNA